MASMGHEGFFFFFFLENEKKKTKLKRKESKVFFQKKIERKWKENKKLMDKNQTKVTSLYEKLYGVNRPP